MSFDPFRPFDTFGQSNRHNRPSRKLLDGSQLEEVAQFSVSNVFLAAKRRSQKNIARRSIATLVAFIDVRAGLDWHRDQLGAHVFYGSKDRSDEIEQAVVEAMGKGTQVEIKG
ncbi:MAG: hypothetical protein IT426_14400 [Pirellulales bacterium]|nr:hypothetical protein [Pirellulales bacterium]